MARPRSLITVRTSAKSTLISPGRVISSAMPCTAPSSTSFAARNASRSVTRPPSTLSSFSFGTVISESTYSDNSLMPSSASSARRRISNGNGLVTTATVRMSSSLAICATTGAAPVPVPPPMPAVMNSMSVPSSASAMRSRSSSADCRPISGLAPAPRPLVTVWPSCSTVVADDLANACASVFAQMKSTPSMELATMCSTALPPPPPTPRTRITAPASLVLSTSSNMVIVVSSTRNSPGTSRASAPRCWPALSPKALTSRRRPARVRGAARTAAARRQWRRWDCVRCPPHP